MEGFRWEEELRRISALHGYRGGLSASQAERMYGIRLRNALNLQSNENLFVPRKYIYGLILKAVRGLDARLYPKDILEELRSAVASYLGVSPGMVLLGQGADQLIGLLVSAFGKGGVGHLVPTYSYYSVMALAHGYRDVGGEDASRILEGRPSLVFMCSPNNPTGEPVVRDQIEAVAEAGPLTVVDEIYAEIAGTSELDLLKKHSNVLIMRSFSKAFGLAGLRVGYLVGPEEVISALSRVQHPFPVSSMSAAAAIEALKRKGYFSRRWEEARETMAWFRGSLSERVKASNSRTYFITVSTGAGTERTFVELLKLGYITRALEPFRGFPDPIRINLAPRRLIEGLPEAINRIAQGQD